MHGWQQPHYGARRITNRLSGGNISCRSPRGCSDVIGCGGADKIARASVSKMDPVAGLQAPLEQLALAVGRLQRELERLTRQCQDKMDEVRELERQLQRAVDSAADPESWPPQHCCAGCGKEFWLRQNAAAYPYVVVPLAGGSAAPETQPESATEPEPAAQPAALPSLGMRRIPPVREYTTRGKTRTCSYCGQAGHSRARCPARFPQTAEP